jgi:hypothetical protein
LGRTLFRVRKRLARCEARGWTKRGRRCAAAKAGGTLEKKNRDLCGPTKRSYKFLQTPVEATSLAPSLFVRYTAVISLTQMASLTFGSAPRARTLRACLGAAEEYGNAVMCAPQPTRVWQVPATQTNATVSFGTSANQRRQQRRGCVPRSLTPLLSDPTPLYPPSTSLPHPLPLRPPRETQTLRRFPGEKEVKRSHSSTSKIQNVLSHHRVD